MFGWRWLGGRVYHPGLVFVVFTITDSVEYELCNLPRRTCPPCLAHNSSGPGTGLIIMIMTGHKQKNSQTQSVGPERH